MNSKDLYKAQEQAKVQLEQDVVKALEQSIILTHKDQPGVGRCADAMFTIFKETIAVSPSHEGVFLEVEMWRLMQKTLVCPYDSEAILPHVQARIELAYGQKVKLEKDVSWRGPGYGAPDERILHFPWSVRR
jgi:hypothetical protein